MAVEDRFFPFNKVTKDVQLTPSVVRTDLHPGDDLNSRRLARGDCLGNPARDVVISNGQSGDAGPFSKRYHGGRRKATVRVSRVQMEVNTAHGKSRLFERAIAQYRSSPSLHRHRAHLRHTRAREAPMSDAA